MENQLTMRRCNWVNMENPLYIRYHDEEWGRPLHDDHGLFELLILEGFQAGLSWECILNKREAFRKAFLGFNVNAVAAMTADDELRLRADTGIVRNKLKIHAAVVNAQVFMAIQQEWGSFDKYIWHWTDGQVIHELYTLRTTSPLSDGISKDLKKRGMKFVGSTIIYSYLQAIGIVNGHGEECELSNQ